MDDLKSMIIFYHIFQIGILDPKNNLLYRISKTSYSRKLSGEWEFYDSGGHVTMFC